MVFIGGWRTPRPGSYGPYGQRGYGYGYRGNSCLRDVCLVESGCCLAEALGCGPQLTLLAPALASRSLRASWPRNADEPSTAEATPTDRSVRILVAAIRLYQQEISARRRHACCRYFPSCSAYTLESLEVHGLGRGLWLGAKRLLRCRPGSAGGYDPVRAAR